jgi:hypothetical protein
MEAVVCCRYADTWFHEYRLRLEKLKEAITDQRSDDKLHALVKESEDAFDELFAEKHRAVDADVLHVMAGLWRTPLEVSFLWNGGLRPTTLFQLIYHMVGAQVENNLGRLLSGGAFPPMASLTGKQLEVLSEMQLETTKVCCFWQPEIFDFNAGASLRLRLLQEQQARQYCNKLSWDFLVMSRTWY